MCRLLAFSHVPDQALCQDACAQFGLLADTGHVPVGFSRGHQDGWGFAAFREQKLALHVRSALAATVDPDYVTTVGKLCALGTDAAIGHIRKSTVGQTKIENTHPFVFGGYAFCHNGTVAEAQRIPLAPAFRQALGGDTDSERFFLFVMQLLDGRGGPEDVRKAIADAVGWLYGNTDFTAVNFLLTDGRFIWAVREFNTGNTFVQERQLGDYYSLFVGGDNRTGCIASSQALRLDGIDWQLLPNHAVAELDCAAPAWRTFDLRS